MAYIIFGMPYPICYMVSTDQLSSLLPLSICDTGSLGGSFVQRKLAQLLLLLLLALRPPAVAAGAAQLTSSFPACLFSNLISS